MKEHEGELARLRESLAERDRQLDEIQRIAGLGTWSWEVASNAVSWSDELYRIYGIDPSAFEGTFEGYLSRVHAEDRALARAAVERAYASGEPFDFEERIVRGDGAVRRLRSRGEVVRDGEGRVLRLVGVCHDVTEKHEAEERERELVLERAQRSAAESLVHRLGFLAEAGELLVSTLDQERTLANVARLCVPALADWCAVDLLDEEGRLVRLAVEHPDPERRELARQLYRRYPPDPRSPHGPHAVIASRQRLHIEQVDDALLEAAAQDEEHLRVLRELQIRAAVVQPLEARGSVLGTLTFVLAESGRRFEPADLALIEDLARGASLAIDNARLVRELERSRDQLELQAEELEAQAEELQQMTEELEASAEDLERSNEDLRLRTREAEEARALAEQANRAKADFLAVVSHELRTPLNAILGYVQLLDLEVHGPIGDAQREALHRIQHGQKRLTRLVEDVLRFAQLDAGRLTFEVRAVQLDRIVQEVRTLVEPQVARKGLRLALDAVPPGLEVSADPEKLEQILLNLLANAVKFTGSGGTIEVGAERRGDLVHIRVSDTGRGIDPAKLELVFEPFVQERSEGGGSEGGFGLGLAISRQLARAMAGDLFATSRPGAGSVFTLALPGLPVLPHAQGMEGSPVAHA